MQGAVDPETLYTKQNCIGGGSFGKVYRGLDKRTGQSVAIKIVEIEAANDDVRDIIEEISILAGLNSPYVTRYYGSYLKGSDLWIVMEFCSGGSCSDLLKPGSISEDYIMIILRELLMGLDYLHADKKLHRDIKAANILLGANGQIKLADFGVSGQLTATMTKKNTFVGTPFWMAPEVIKQAGYDQKADMWSLGITAIELAMGEPPYADIHPMKVLFLIPKHAPPKLEGNFSTGFKDFVSLCLRRDPRERPTARELLKHPWLKKARKPTYLTELIERHERWQAQHGSDADYESEGEDEGTRRASHDEDLWDFGTIRPLHGAGPPRLKTLNDAGANARNSVSQKQQFLKPGFEFGEDENSPVSSSGVPRLAPMKIPLPSSPAIGFASEIRNQEPPKSPAVSSTQYFAASPAKHANSSPLKQLPQVSRKALPQSTAQSTKEASSHSDTQRSPLSPAPTAYSTPLQTPRFLEQHASPGSPFASQATSVSQPEQRRDQSQTHSTSAGGENTVSLPLVAAMGGLAISPYNATSQTGADTVSFRTASTHAGPADASSTSSPTRAPQPSLPSSEATQSQHDGRHQPRNVNEPSESALGSVILPALHAALHRRTYHLNRMHAQPNATSASPSKAKNQIAAHQAIQKLTAKIGRLCEELDKWDRWAPVGMGDEVPGFLEGWLEEVLVRVEAE